MKTAIVTDSTSYIPEELRKQLDIYMIPLSVVMGGKSYREEIDLSTAAFYEAIKQEDQLPTTTQPPIGEFVSLFETLGKKYDAIISFHLSSGISGTYQGAVSAAAMVDGVEIYPYDSETSCMAQGFYTLEAAKMAQEGKDVKEILARVGELHKHLRAYFMVDDLVHLQRGGRLTNAQAFIGSLLKVKPLLHFVDKKIVPFEKIRTSKKALKRIEDLLGEDVQKAMPLQASIIHANREQEALEWKQELESKFPQVAFSISYFGPVIGTHLGEGAMGLAWTLK